MSDNKTDHYALMLEDIKELSSVARQRIEQYLGNRHMWSDAQLRALFDQVHKLRDSVAEELLSRNAWAETVYASKDVLVLRIPK